MVQILQIIITIVITCFSSALNEAEKDAKECFSYNLPKEIDLINLNECNKTKTYTRYVFNGKLAAPNTFPYIVSLQHYGNHFCGGSIVHRRWVMTAKHCISSRRIGVKVNLDNNNRGAGKVYYARRTFVHPGSSIIDGDVALLMLDENIDFEGGKIHKIRLGLNDPASDTPLTLAGWGKTERGNPTRLMTEQTIFRSTRVCRRYLGWSFVPEKMICAKGSRGDACFGDSGGPLVLKGSSTKDDYQYGVVSWGRNPCGRWEVLHVQFILIMVNCFPFIARHRPMHGLAGIVLGWKIF